MPVASALISAVPPMMQSGAGLVQSIIGASREKKATKALENLKTPTYSGSRSIMDYYDEARRKYNVSPYSSEQYQYAQKAANSSLASGLNALQDRRSAVGNINKLVAARNDSLLKAGALAEQNRNQNFGQLGNAANMKAGDEMKQFQFNKLAPYEKKFNLLAAKASGGAQMFNAGLQNVFGGGSNASMIGSDYAMNMPMGNSGGNSNIFGASKGGGSKPPPIFSY